MLQDCEADPRPLTGGDPQLMEEEEEPFRSAVRFLAPLLGHFSFRPSHAIAIGKADGELPAMDRKMKVRIIRAERQGDIQRATTEFFDWLLGTLPSEPDALRPFLHVLCSDTTEHQHVHNLLCLCSVYLPVHLPLLAPLSHRLADGTVQLPVLLGLLQRLGLLYPERAPHIVNIAGPGVIGDACAVRAVTFLLTSLYETQAKIVHDLHSTAARIACSRANCHAPQPPVTRSFPDATGHADADVTAGVTRETKRDLMSDDDASLSLLLTVDPNRWSPDVAERLVQDPARWPEMLTLVLALASQRDREWPYALSPQDVPSLWEAASGLIGSGLRVSSKEQGQPVTTDNASDAESDNSASTLTANHIPSNNFSSTDIHPKMLNQLTTKDVLLKKLLVDSLAHHADASPFPDDDASSLASVETNSRQRGRTVEESGDGGGGGSSGVLREEEMRALTSGPIQLRPYQDELLEAARRGRNVLIWLPTGTGKTYIVLKYAEEHLKADSDRRVAFVVPKVRLARQQYERFLAYLPDFIPHLKCGETTTTAGGKQPLGEVLKTSRVVVVTGQSLVEAVERRRVSLESFSLLVLDECHHTRGGHPLRVLMNQYMEGKFLRQPPRLPQVMGLTASPGVGKARGKEVEEAAKYLKQLCARLDVSHICNVRQNTQDLKQYVHEPMTDVKECEKRKVDRLKIRLEMLMKKIEDKMIVNCELEKYLTHPPKKPEPSRSEESVLRQLRAPEGLRGQDQYTQWLANAERTSTLVQSQSDLTHPPKKPEPSRSEESVLRQLRAPEGLRGQDQYTQWLANAERTVKDVGCRKSFYALNAHIDILKLCQRCLILNEDCDSLDALELLKEEVDVLRKEKPLGDNNLPLPVDQELFDLFDRYTSHPHTQELRSLREECYRKDCQNPKLTHLENLLLNSPEDHDPKTAERKEPAQTDGSCDSSSQTLVKQTAQPGPHIHEAESEELAGSEGEEEDPERMSEADSTDWSSAESVITDSDREHLKNVRGMIFVRTLDLSKALLKWMKRHPKLKNLNPDRITGVNASVKNGGMTKREVTEVMSKFNGGTIKVVICTSAAEEGLDFKACNFVIRYLYEASMVSMIQIRGRARDANSRYSVLGRPNTLGKERDNVESEMAMREAVERIQRAADKDPNAHYWAIQKMQREAWNNRWKKDVDERKRLQQRLQPGEYRLLCRKCRRPACSSKEIRILRKTNRTVIGAEFSNKYQRQKDDNISQAKAYDQKIPRTGKIHCKGCGSYWGIIVRSVDDGVEFPVIPIKSFLVDDGAGENRFIEKWSKAFEVPELSEEDLLRHSEPLLGTEDRLEGDVEPEEPELGGQGQDVERDWDEPLLDARNGSDGGETDDEQPEEDQQENHTRGPSAEEPDLSAGGMESEDPEADQAGSAPEASDEGLPRSSPQLELAVPLPQ